MHAFWHSRSPSASLFFEPGKYLTLTTATAGLRPIAFNVNLAEGLMRQRPLENIIFSRHHHLPRELFSSRSFSASASTVKQGNKGHEHWGVFSINRSIALFNEEWFRMVAVDALAVLARRCGTGRHQ